ncbi:hypothetical protein BFR57_02535 [Idiomarina sp. MD25a]|uniref:polysaccharide lyase n=1 Tax=Idiomarina sp. MD25a TaxID=1889913 RepID=UPI0008F9065B|nr:hypothetical protein [Idiomarina sp. MD25a]OIM99462.1 hypothetical protein BFR57_02535 [Idiomarina sp. MD25a]
MLRKLYLTSLLILLSSCAIQGEQLGESFDDSQDTPLYLSIKRIPHTKILPNVGTQGSRGVKVYYYGYERGSKRVLLDYPIPDPGRSYKLSFDVRFCEGFDFAKGGKLHGLGPFSPITGGNKVNPNGWSARGIWLADGGLATYLYHQKLPHKYGTSRNAKGFKFETGRYYRLTYILSLNYPTSAANGFFKILVNGKEVVSHENIQFRASGHKRSLIQRFMFNTFHGGSTPSHAPRDEKGQLKVDCAYFDNFQVQDF